MDIAALILLAGLATVAIDDEPDETPNVTENSPIIAQPE